MAASWRGQYGRLRLNTPAGSSPTCRGGRTERHCDQVTHRLQPGRGIIAPRPSAALQEIQAALGAAKDAQKKRDFAGYGAALQRLNDAITKYNNAK